MIITRSKQFSDILSFLKDSAKVFIVGCNECARDCKTGGEPEVLKMKEDIEKAGKAVTGWVVPDAPCNAARIKMALVKNLKAVKDADVILSMSCGLGSQSIKENDRFKKPVITANDTICMGVTDKDGNMQEECSSCGECILNITGGICPLTRCPKNLMNGPCGGMNKGKCEVDKERDCAWVLIYNELKAQNKLHLLRQITPPKDWSKTVKPRKLILG